MDGGLCRRQFEDQPAVTGIDKWQLKNVAKEYAISLGIVAVEQNVSGIDHEKEFIPAF